VNAYEALRSIQHGVDGWTLVEATYDEQKRTTEFVYERHGMLVGFCKVEPLTPKRRGIFGEE
jgi:hypothetical protein